MEMISINNLSFTYPECKNEAIHDVSLKVNKGDFIAMCGKSGSGKSTLLSLMKPELSPQGKREGNILFCGKTIENLSLKESATRIGFVQQNIEYQIVTHSVRSELAFGLENLNLDDNIITRSIAETASFFNLSDSLDKRVTELSGGEKQMLCLASICSMHPDLIILDEPASQLDPVSLGKLVNVLNKLNKEFGVTVIISEHRLDQVIPISNRVVIMDNGKIIYDDEPKNLININTGLEYVYDLLPVHIRLCAKLQLKPSGITVYDAKKALENALEYVLVDEIGSKPYEAPKAEYAINIKHLYYCYDKDDYVLKDLSLKVKKNTIFGLMGENGSGKTTLVKLLTGLLENKRGKILINENNLKDKNFDLYSAISFLPQKCESLFAGPTILDDLLSCYKYSNLSKEQKLSAIHSTASFWEIDHLLDSHPYDVSGGEMQKCALCMVLLKNASILFLDEPTKGIDSISKTKLSNNLKTLANNGITVFMVCHDIEFLANTADECAMLFDGKIISQCNSQEFFTSSYFYTTTSYRITEGVFKNAINEKMVLELWRKNH